MPSARITQLAVYAGRLFLLLLLATLSSPVFGQMWNWGYDPNWASHLSVGAMGGFNIKANFKTGGIYSLNPAPGVYSDGYVHPSQNANGLTSNWGYEDSSQVVGQTLAMHQITGFEVPNGSQNVNADPSVGFQAAYGGNLWYVSRFRIGWEFGFGWLPLKITGNESSAAAVDQSSFIFNTGGITMPTAPYHGTASGYGPNISTNFTSGPSTNGAPGTLTGSQTLDLNLFTFRLGPSVYWDFNHHVGMSLGAGPALGYVPGRLKFNETISTTPVTGVANTVSTKSQGSINVSDVVYGWYVNTMVTVHLVRNGDLFIGAEYMPLGTANFSGGGRAASLNLKGQIYATAGINWPF